MTRRCPAPRRGRQRRPRRRLFWRIYLQGLLLLLATAIAAGVLSKMFEASPWASMQERAHTFATDEISRTPTHALEDRLDHLHALLQTDLALYTLDGIPLATAGLQPFPPPSPQEARDLQKLDKRHEDGITAFLVPVTLADDTPAVLILSWDSRANFIRFLFSLLAILGVVALVLYPLARAIARPLERITDAAGAIAQGDLSARSNVRRKDEIGVLAKRFDAMAERIEHLIRSEKELMANVSHELRTPLARIRIALELSEDEHDPQALHEQLQGIELDARELEHLVDEVLTAARLDLAQGDAMSSVLRIEPVSAAEIVQASAERFQTHHPEHHLELEISSELPVIHADPELLRRVFDNLLDNAIKYGESPFRLSASSTDEALLISVRDHGSGVSPDHLERLFQPFYREDTARTSQGLGLGLTLCQRIVEAHYGFIVARSPESGTGLLVEVTLPA